MQEKLTQMLHMEREPVGICFANTTAVCDPDADPEKRNCVIPLLMKVSEGQTVSMDEKAVTEQEVPPDAALVTVLYVGIRALPSFFSRATEMTPYFYPKAGYRQRYPYRELPATAEHTEGSGKGILRCYFVMI